MINFAIKFTYWENLFLISEGMTRVKNELNRNEDFMKLYNHLECLFAHSHSTSASGISTIVKGLVFLLKLYIVSSSSRLILKFCFIDPHTYSFILVAVDLQMIEIG